MRVRTTLVLAALAAVALTYVLYEEYRYRPAEAVREAERRVVDFDPAAVREITIETPGERVVVRATPAGWRLIDPAAGSADGRAVEGLLAFVRRLEKVRSVGTPADLRAYGLAEPRVRLALVLDTGAALTLRLGDSNPAGTGVYAALEGAPAVFLAPGDLARELARSPYVDQLRDRRLVPIDPDRVRRLEIERAGVRVAVVRVGAHAWRVERPFTGDGDDGIIRDLLWKIAAARARATIPDGAPGAYGLDRPHARARILDEAGASRALTLTLAASGAPDLYVEVAGAPGVQVTDQQLLWDLAIDPDRLRDRQLLPHDPRDVERIAVRYPDRALVLARGADGWWVVEPVAGRAMRLVVENLLEVLPNIRWTAVAAPAPGDLRAWGLDRPRYVVTLGLRGGRTLGPLAVGRAEGGAYFAMVADRPLVYKIDARLLRVLPEDPADARHDPLAERLKRAYERQAGGR